MGLRGAYKAPEGSTTGWIRPLWLLLWKNYRLKRHRPVASILEIALPALCLWILVYAKSKTENLVRWREQEGFYPFSPNEQPRIMDDTCKDGWVLGYVPTGAQDIVQSAIGYAGGGDVTAASMGFDTEDDLIAAFGATDNYNLEGCRVGVVFTNLNDGSDEPLSYKLRFEATPGGYRRKNFDEGPTEIPSAGIKAFLPGRTWLTDQTFPRLMIPGPRRDIELYAPTYPDIWGNAPGYYDYGYLMWQQAIATAIMSEAGIDTDAFENIQLRRMIYPAYKEDYFTIAIQFGLPILLMISMFFSVISIARAVTYEKEKGLKVALQMMGMPNWMHWMGWFLIQEAGLLLAIIPITLQLALGKVLPHCDASLIFVYLLLYTMATISFSFCISTLFHKASSAAAGSGIAWFVSYFPYFFVYPRYFEVSSRVKHLASILPNTSMALGATIIALEEAGSIGVTWANYATPIAPGETYTFQSVLGMLLVDAIFYGLLAVYVDQINPGPFGIPKTWYFPVASCIQYFKRINQEASSPEERISLLHASQDDADDVTDGSREAVGSGRNFERHVSSSDIGISIRGLTKTFIKKVAVDNVDLDAYEDEITVLLGHNGAGKTTTMRMLCGMFKPDAGTAKIHGFDIVRDTYKAQRSMGVCPQHDVLFETMTPMEHLWFFCALRGANSYSATDQAHEMLRSLELESRGEFAVSKLSGGQRRRLSVGIALVGGSRVVVLDEPTSGMDPNARRITWSLLERCKLGRTILLSTHFMDEADLIGDRIAILAKGRLWCCGSPFFLKNELGTGYRLTIMKDKDNFDIEAVTAIIQNATSDSELVSDIGMEVCYNIPNVRSSAIPGLLEILDVEKENHGITGYGICVTSIEDVFIEVGRIADEEAHSIGVGAISKEEADLSYAGRVGSSPLLTQQARDLHKRMRSTRSLECLDDIGAEIKVIVANGDIAGDDVVILRKVYTRQRLYLNRINDRNKGYTLLKDQFKALLRKRALSTIRDKYQLAIQLLPPFLFTLLALIVVSTSPGSRDLPSRSLTSISSAYPDATIFVTPQVPASIAEAIQTQVGASATVQYMTSDDVEGLILNATNGSDYRTAIFNSRTPAIIAMDDDGDITGYFNGQGYHTVAEVHALIASALLAQSGAMALSTANEPLPRTAAEQAKEQSLDQDGFAISFAVMFGMAPMVSSVVIFLVKETQSRAKHLQHVTGASIKLFWVSTFAHDIIVYLVASIASLILFPLFSFEGFAGVRWWILLLVYTMYGMAVIPVMYLLSKICRDPSVAFVRLTMLNIITGLGALTVISVLDTADPESAENWRFWFGLLPNYNMAQAMSDLYTNYQTQQIVAAPCKALGIDVAQCCAEIQDQLVELDIDYQIQCTTNFLRWEAPGLGKYMFCLTLQAVLFPILLLLVEYGTLLKSFASKQASAAMLAAEQSVRERWPQHIHQRLSPMDSVSDIDVLTERAAVAAMVGGDTTPASDSWKNERESRKARRTDAQFKNAIVLDGLSKVYTNGTISRKYTRAVHNLCFLVKPGECFGLLGTNGAGKTTTFKMLTGDLGLSGGDAWLDGYSATQHMRAIQQNIGYCPQFDALLDKLTGRETLEMYARLRGIPKEVLRSTVDRLLTQLDLVAHENICTGEYSGGTKRKLSMAIALIGSPSILLLDEPTTGMDPVARQLLAKTLLTAQSAGASIVLTSHSMEECQALCNRLGIMVRGELRCIGSPQHLRGRFGDAFTVEMRVSDKSEEGMDIAWGYFKEKCPRSLINKVNTSTLELKVPYRPSEGASNTSISMGSLFSLLSAMQQEDIISDYSVSEATLHEIFLSVTSDLEKPRTGAIRAGFV